MWVVCVCGEFGVFFFECVVWRYVVLVCEEEAHTHTGTHAHTLRATSKTAKKHTGNQALGSESANAQRVGQVRASFGHPPFQAPNLRARKPSDPHSSLPN